MPRARRCRTFDFDPEAVLYDAAFGAMSDAGKSAYFMLLCHAWLEKDPGLMPYSRERFANLTRRTARQWRRIEEQVGRAFDTTETGFWKLRVMEETLKGQHKRIEGSRAAVLTRYATPKAGTIRSTILPTPDTLLLTPDLDGGLSPPIPPTPDGAVFQPDPGDDPGETEDARRMVSGLAVRLAVPKPPADWTKGAWEDARAVSESPEQANELMKFAGWVMKHHQPPKELLYRMFRKIIAGGIRAPMAYYSENGNAYQALAAEVAVQRQVRDHRAHDAADKRFLNR